LLWIPVTASASVDDDALVVLDKRAVLSAWPLSLAVSEHAAFRQDAHRDSIDLAHWCRGYPS
jgi:hypothetical protein